jgi:hypothetical protein
MTLGWAIHGAAGQADDMRRGINAIGDLGGIDEDQLFRADVDAIQVRQAAATWDDRTIDHDTVTAAEILDDHRVRRNMKHRVLSGGQRVRNRETAFRATTDRKRPQRQF